MAAWVSGEHLILDLTSEDESGDWVEGAEDSLSAIVGVRAELAAGDLRPLYLAWLAAYGTWERDEDAFDYDEEDELEPPVPAGLGALTAPQRALADFLRLDADLLTIAAQASPPLAETKDHPRKLARWIKDLPAGDKDTLLYRVAQGHGAQVQMELRRRFRGDPIPPATAVPAVRWPNCWTPPPKLVTSGIGRPKPGVPRRRPAARASPAAGSGIKG